MALEERDHYCASCGRWLFATTVPLGTPGAVRLKCGERSCNRQQAPRVGEPPAERIDRDAWVARARANRKTASADHQPRC